MAKHLATFLLLFIAVNMCKAQNITDNKTQFHSQSFGIQGGLSLLGAPLELYQIVNLSYSRTILGKERHQLAVLPQIATISLPDVERKFLFSTSVQYKYVSRKRLEANAFLGVNYQLRRLAYDRYSFEDNTLKNKGRLLHQFGPIVGLNAGYKIIKKNNFSIAPQLGLSLVKLNKTYEPNLFGGYKPNLFFGLNLNL